jgi:hippurate hydrolase
VLEDVRRVSQHVAAAHGADVTVDITRGYPVTINDERFAGFALDVARELGGAGAAEPLDHPVMGSEDFSYVLQRVPGAMVFLGTKPQDGPAYPNHSTRMRVHEPAMTTGMALHAAVALRFLGRT